MDRGRRAAMWVSPHHPLQRRGLGGELDSELTTGVLERCGVGLLCCWIRAAEAK